MFLLVSVGLCCCSWVSYWLDCNPGTVLPINSVVVDLDLPDPDPSLFVWIRIQILPSSSKNSKKNFPVTKTFLLPTLSIGTKLPVFEVFVKLFSFRQFCGAVKFYYGSVSGSGSSFGTGSRSYIAQGCLKKK